MSPKGSVSAAHIWKRFRADRRRSLLRDEVARLSARLRRQTETGWRWALRDVGMVLAPGESVGLFGANGSGKSTLLKVLCRVMYPDAGRLDVSGRVGALIEVSAGIHPELSGRENAYLYGSILGLSRKSVSRRFDEIVAFAEVEQAIDRQVKFYSSGMKMRLGFAVAAFLDPDILLVDEVLAVGDASFQQKCLERMRAVISEGVSLIFVSHDLAAVEATCSRGVWLNNGVVAGDGPVSETLAAYREVIEQAAELAPMEDGDVRLVAATVTGTGGIARTRGELDIRLVARAAEHKSSYVYLGVSEGPATPIFCVRREAHLVPGDTEIRCRVGPVPLPRGRYYLWVGMFAGLRGGGDILPWHPAAHFDLSGPDLDPAPRAVVRLAPVHVDSTWEMATTSGETGNGTAGPQLSDPVGQPAGLDARSAGGDLEPDAG